MIKEGVLNVLAKAGGTIREQLAVTSRYHCQISNILNPFYCICVTFLLSLFYAVRQTLFWRNYVYKAVGDKQSMLFMHWLQ